MAFWRVSYSLQKCRWGAQYIWVSWWCRYGGCVRNWTWNNEPCVSEMNNSTAATWNSSSLLDSWSRSVKVTGHAGQLVKVTGRAWQRSLSCVIQACLQGNQSLLVERIPPPPTLTFDLDLPEFNHLVHCGQGYDWPSLVTIGRELATGSCSQTYLLIYIYTIYLPTYRRHHLWWER